MKNMKFLALGVLAAVVSTGVSAKPNAHFSSLLTQYRTPQAAGELVQTKYFQARICDQGNVNNTYVLTAVIPNNPALGPNGADSNNNGWDPAYGVVLIEISSSAAFLDTQIVASNYLYHEKPKPQTVFIYNTQIFRDGIVYIRVMSYKATTRVILNLARGDGTQDPNQWTHDSSIWQPPQNKQITNLVQYADGKTEQVNNIAFAYFSVSFCNIHPQTPVDVRATAFGTDIYKQTALNLLICRNDTNQHIAVDCTGTGTPATLAAAEYGSPVVTAHVSSKTSGMNINNFVVGVQGQGGYKSKNGNAINEFQLSVIIDDGRNPPQ